MSEFYFKCPHCNANICADDDMIGEKAPCPGCGKIVVIEKPTPSQIKKSAQKSPKKLSGLQPKSDKTNAMSNKTSAKSSDTNNATPSDSQKNYAQRAITVALTILFTVALTILCILAGVIIVQLNRLNEQIETDGKKISVQLNRLNEQIETIKDGKKISYCSVEHYVREQYASGLDKAISAKIEAGYEPVGKICNDGINGAYFLFIKRKN